MILLNLFPWVLLAAVPEQFFKFSMLWVLVWFALSAYLNMVMLDKPLERLMELSRQALQGEETAEPT